MVFHTFAEREEGLSIEEPGTGIGIAFQKLNLHPPCSLPGGSLGAWKLCFFLGNINIWDWCWGGEGIFDDGTSEPGNWS